MDELKNKILEEDLSLIRQAKSNVSVNQLLVRNAQSELSNAELVLENLILKILIKYNLPVTARINEQDGSIFLIDTTEKEEENGRIE